jgi:hypothetical protein
MNGKFEFLTVFEHNKTSGHLEGINISYLYLIARVTRLGEFSPTGLLLTLGSFLKNTQVAQFLGNFFRGTSY